uniref:Nucleolin 1 n=1 Tax=Noccaea caerulescens TaxID=107243 RepID=A0A1J3EAH3_NOCCA
MDESAAVEGMQLTGKSISKKREGRSRYVKRDGRIRKRVLIVAEGFDVSVPEGCTRRNHVFHLESKLKDHFSSCGKIKSVCIPHPYYSSTIKRHAYIEILGEGAKEKALELNGIEMDGHKLVVTAPLLPLKRKALKSAKRDRSSRSELIFVRGYDTSLPRKIIKRALGKHFSSCGEVLEVDVVPNQTYPKARNHAYVDIYGEDAKEKALQLSGSDMGGFKLVVEKLGPKPRQPGDEPIDDPIDIFGSPTYSEFMAVRNKRKEEREANKRKEEERNSNKRKENPNPHSNKRKENPNSHSNEKKKKRKTSK